MSGNRNFSKLMALLVMSGLSGFWYEKQNQWFPVRILLNEKKAFDLGRGEETEFSAFGQ